MGQVLVASAGQANLAELVNTTKQHLRRHGSLQSEQIDESLGENSSHAIESDNSPFYHGFVLHLGVTILFGSTFL